MDLSDLTKVPVDYGDHSLCVMLYTLNIYDKKLDKRSLAGIVGISRISNWGSRRTTRSSRADLCNQGKLRTQVQPGGLLPNNTSSYL